MSRLFLLPHLCISQDTSTTLPTHLLLLINFTLTAILCGLIWTIQLVHYPSFFDVGESEYNNYQQNHMRNISLLVIPLMLLELGFGIYLQIEHLNHDINTLIYAATFLLLFIWGVTFFISSPLHGKLLGLGYNYENIDRLVRTNWLRTIAWTGRLIIFFIILYK